MALGEILGNQTNYTRSSSVELVRSYESFCENREEARLVLIKPFRSFLFLPCCSVSCSPLAEPMLSRDTQQ